MPVALQTPPPRSSLKSPCRQARRVLVAIQYFHEDKLGAYRRLANFMEGNERWRFLMPSHRTDGAWTVWGQDEGNLEVVGIPPRWPGRGQFLGWLRYALQYLRSMRHSEPPVSVVYMVAPPAWWALPAAWAARRHGIPCVLDLGDSAESQAKGLWRLTHVAAERLLRRWSRRVVVASPDLVHDGDRFILTGVTDEFFRIGERRLVDVDLGPTLDPRVFYCGTFSELQNLDCILNAWPRVTEKAPGARLTMVGWGPKGEEDRLKALAERLRLGDRVAILDRVPPESIPGLLLQADWGLVSLDPRPELDYAMPTKMMEYFAAGLPVLGVGGGRVRETLHDSGGGAWVDPNRLASFEGGNDLVRILTADRRALAEQAFAYARTHCGHEVYQRAIDDILTSTLPPWSPAVERAVQWLEGKAFVWSPEVSEGTAALRHSLAPARVESADCWAYPEGTAYGLSLYLALHRLNPRPRFLERARQMAAWLTRGQTEEGGLPFIYDLNSRRYLGPCYAFDTAMAIRAWLMLDRVDPDPRWREAAERAGEWLIERMQQRDGSFHAVDREEGAATPMPAPDCYYGTGGALQIKLALALRDLAGPNLENEPFHRALRRLLAWGITLVNREGAFRIGRGTEDVNAHTHSYALEGLTCIPELTQCRRKGILWSANRVTRRGWMPRAFNNGTPDPKAGIDATAQTLRLIALALRGEDDTGVHEGTEGMWGEREDIHGEQERRRVERKDDPVLRSAGERIAHALRSHQRADGGWGEFADSPSHLGPPVWPTLLAVSALLFWERADLETDYLF